MTIEVDRSIYSDSCISKTIYWLSNSYAIERRYVDGKEYIDIHPKDTDKKESESDIRSIFLQHLNDYKLREIIRAETKDINTILYIKAFADCEELLDEENGDI